MFTLRNRTNFHKEKSYIFITLLNSNILIKKIKVLYKYCFYNITVNFNCYNTSSVLHTFI